MRGRSDCDTWSFLPTTFPQGPGTTRPFLAYILLPNPDRAACDTVAAIFYRYKTLIARMDGAFSFSDSFELSGDDWELSLGGTYSIEATADSGGVTEGGRYLYPSGGGATSTSVTFNGSCTLTNTTTGDVWGTDEPEPRKLEFVGQDNGFVNFIRGAKIFRNENGQISTELIVRGQIGVSVKSTTFSNPSVSTIFFAQRKADNEDGLFSLSGTCALNIFNLYDIPAPIPVFNDPRTETPVITVIAGIGSAELEARASSSATLSIHGGDIWPHGFDPDNHTAFTDLNALWSPSGEPTRSISEVLNAPLNAP